MLASTNRAGFVAHSGDQSDSAAFEDLRANAMRTPQNVYRRFIDFEEKAAAIYLKLASRFSD